MSFARRVQVLARCSNRSREASLRARAAISLQFMALVRNSSMRRGIMRPSFERRRGGNELLLARTGHMMLISTGDTLICAKRGFSSRKGRLRQRAFRRPDGGNAAKLL